MLFCPISQRKKSRPFESAPVRPFIITSTARILPRVIRLFTQISCVFFPFFTLNFYSIIFISFGPYSPHLFSPSFSDFVRSKGDPVGHYCGCFFRLCGRNSDILSPFNRSRSQFQLSPRARQQFSASKASKASVYIARSETVTPRMKISAGKTHRITRPGLLVFP